MAFSYENYYELLDIPRHASLEEIQRAYQKARALYSPDSPAIYSMFSEEEARDLVKVIDQAFQTLSNPQARSEYDLSLSGESPDDIVASDSDDIYGLSGESTMDSPVNTVNETPQATQPVIQNEQSNFGENSETMGSTKFGSYVKNEEVEFYIQNEVNIDGEFLKTVREYKQIQIDQISSYTKIGAHHIRAIEANQYSELPPVVFTKGFIRQIAGLLGLDQKHCADSYIKLMKQHL
jgi:curved DNA-binding protein CbpA